MLLHALQLARRQRARRDLKQFDALIATPGNLATGVSLPANADLHVSTSSVLATVTLLVDANAAELGVRAGAANRTHPVGWFGRDVVVKKHTGAPGTVSLYVEDAFGGLIKIAEG